MGIFDKILGSSIESTVSAVGGVLDNITTTDEERLKAKEQLTSIVTNFATSLAASQAEVLKVELSGNWLQRSWRPLMMLAFGVIVIYRYFIAPTFSLPITDLPEQFWSLLEIGMGGYVIGRSVEKVADSVAKNFDKLPRKNN